MRMHGWTSILICACAIGTFCTTFAVSEPLVGGSKAAEVSAATMAQSLALFKSDVRDVLAENCVECHGGKERRSLFDLTTREGLLAGGEIGVPVRVGNAEASNLIDYLRHRQKPYMPTKRPPLSDDVIAKIARWIDLGAAYDKAIVPPPHKRTGSLQVTDRDREYWAYAPLRAVFPSNASIATLVRAKQSELKLTPAPPAEKRTLIRRLYFDTIGLPPDPATLKSFLADKSPGAYERLVDKLLANPHFGERWARHWLDVARFAESHGFEHDYARRFAYPYRDFVIRAFNEDLPYDEFVRWQIAGDELAPDNPAALIATGFLAAGVYSTQITVKDAERARYESMDDMLATTGSAMLATTVGCARCHDHKFDPIPTRDYYRMLSAFTTTVRSEINVRAAVFDQAKQLGPPDVSVVSEQRARPQTVMIASEGVMPLRLHVSNEQIPDFYQQTYILEHGDPKQKAGVAELGFLQVLTRTDDVTRWMEPAKNPHTSGRRAALARWITDTKYGAGHLLARAIVNRLWQHYFGRGIVATPDDFGSQGERPTHPLLLDWLATELIRNGWHLKPIHKLILMSGIYQQADFVLLENERIDPENRYLWRHLPRRLEAEAIRDNALAVSGMIDESMFGPGTLDDSSRRRSIYFMVKRSRLVPMMQVFDWPDALTSMGERPVTTTASQALIFLNNGQMRRMAAEFARRLMQEPDWLGESYLRAYGRPPSDRERTLGEEFVRRQSQSYEGDLHKALTDFCAALMSASEFIYVE